ncbi:MAG: IS200/IS605 family transposase [Elusimicrobiota bacterium]|jgi:putative transposase|nr:IS200/IS605 family transposase [Elusimicrobiota bacterium]
MPKYAYRKQGHSVYYCKYHLVITTKYRKRILRWGLYTTLKYELIKFTRKHPEIAIEEVNHDKNHIHILISIPPKLSISEVVRLLKCNTGREIRKKFKFLDKIYFGSDGIWSEGYFVSTVGFDEAAIRKYIEGQRKEEEGQTALLFEF